MIKNAFNWLRQKKNRVGILVFISILCMGASIAPTIKGGKVFVAAIQYEQMAEASPVYAVVRSIEAQTEYYVLSVQDTGSVTAIWVLPPKGEDYESLDQDLYIMFASAQKHFGAQDCIIIEAMEITFPGMNGAIPGFSASGFYVMTAEALEVFIDAGAEDANDILQSLFGHGFDAQRSWNSMYMITLLPREPGHVPPWEAE